MDTIDTKIVSITPMSRRHFPAWDFFIIQDTSFKIFNENSTSFILNLEFRVLNSAWSRIPSLHCCYKFTAILMGNRLLGIQQLRPCYCVVRQHDFARKTSAGKLCVHIRPSLKKSSKFDYTIFHKKLVHKKLVLRWPKF